MDSVTQASLYASLAAAAASIGIGPVAAAAAAKARAGAQDDRPKHHAATEDTTGRPPKRPRTEGPVHEQTGEFFLGKPVDYSSSVIAYLKRLPYASPRERYFINPHELHAKDVLTPGVMNCPVSCVCENWIHTFRTARKKLPTQCCYWTGDGRKIIIGTKGGEIVLLNGTAFNALHQFLPHQGVPVNCLASLETEFMKHGTDLTLSGSNHGKVYYWQSNMVCVCEVTAHAGSSVRDICVAPSCHRFATASEDASVKVWDLLAAATDPSSAAPLTAFHGHGHNVFSCDWHPSCSVIASGSSDRTVKLWDIRQDKGLVSTLQQHTNTVTKVQFNRNGYQLLSAGKDAIRLVDIRNMKEVTLFRDSTLREYNTVAWHPIHSELFASGAHDGSVAYWFTDDAAHVQAKDVCGPLGCQSTPALPITEDHKQLPAAVIEGAHSQPGLKQQTVFAVTWHPLGHLLATVGVDATVKVWGRGKPGQAEATTSE